MEDFRCSAVRTLLVFPLAASLMLSSSAFAGQQHVVTPSQLATTVSEVAAKQDTIGRLSARRSNGRQSRRWRRSSALISARATAAVDMMSGAELEKAASAAQQVNDQLVGGASTIVISTTTIIIILLLVIILIIAVK